MELVHNQTQRVSRSVDNHLSNTSSVTFSVPQGSILDALLFLIFVND